MFIISLGILFYFLISSQFCLPAATERATPLAAEETNGLFSEAAHLNSGRILKRNYFTLIRSDETYVDFSPLSETFHSLNVVKHRKNQQSNKRTCYSLWGRVISCDFVHKTLLFCKILFFLQCWHCNLFILRLILLTSVQSFELIFRFMFVISLQVLSF